MYILFYRQHFRLFKYFLAFRADPFPVLVSWNDLSCQSSAAIKKFLASVADTSQPKPPDVGSPVINVVSVNNPKLIFIV
jgi:hypothetical protein